MFVIGYLRKSILPFFANGFYRAQTHTQKKRQHTAERQAARGELRHIFHPQPSSIHLLEDLWPFILRRTYTSVIIRSRPITSYTLMYVYSTTKKKNILFEKNEKVMTDALSYTMVMVPHRFRSIVTAPWWHNKMMRPFFFFRRLWRRRVSFMVCCFHAFRFCVRTEYTLKSFSLFRLEVCFVK